MPKKFRARQRINYGEVTYLQYKDLQSCINHVEKELCRLDRRLDRLDDKLDHLENRLENRLDRLTDKIDGLKETKSPVDYLSIIATISTLGIAIAVIYSLLR